MNEKAKYHHKKDTYTLFIVFSWDLVLDIVYVKKTWVFIGSYKILWNIVISFYFFKAVEYELKLNSPTYFLSKKPNYQNI